MKDWNVIATVHEGEFHAACRVLRAFGELAPTEFHNVVVLRVDDPARFTQALGERVAAEPGILNMISRVVPATRTFVFRDTAAFEDRAREAALALAPALAGCRFHVRMHRRGFRHRISSQDEERRLDGALLDALEAAGTPGTIGFDDPDAILAVETLGQQAGMSVWTREDLRRYPFLKLD